MSVRVTPTVLDQVEPIDSEVPPRETQASDPPTSVVRRHAIRMSGDDCIELPPGSIVGETYEIDALLGAGAMGEVYAARHLRLGKRVAIKVIGPQLSEDASAIERFALEAKTLAKIQHPAIVAVEHVGELADGRAYFVMELLLGETTFDRLRRGKVPLPEALRIIDQIARGLEAAHAQGVVHRDLKPENIFLVHLPGELPIVKLVDFGLAKLRIADQRAERTQSGVALGTPMYMAPEQMRGPDVDPRADIYALGCIAYELLLGAAPFPHARTVPELFAAHLHETPPLPRAIWPEIPPQLDLALFAMLAKDPAHRPTLAQIRAVIAATRAPAPPTVFVGPRAPRSKKLAILAVALTALVGGILIGSMLTRAPNDPRRNDAASAQVSTPPRIVTPVPAAPIPTAPILPAASSPVVTKVPAKTAPSSTRPKDVDPRVDKMHPRIIPERPAEPAGSADTPVTIPDPVPLPSTSNMNQTINPFKHKDKVTP